ncbi:uncharacterized protein LOC131850970 [Achroia grisella]|uniref:uncharacterized protein LOC131850970 n=1 Tax=Achroia grisella TaxID=688607 RepID=UPI0027D2AEB3|nr:uncharacterized protein LOC131850970 [Achroia grisella]
MKKGPQNTKRHNKGSPNPQLINKPFCDCTVCACNNCPDILRMLAITVTDKSCDFGPKVKGKTKKTSQYCIPNVTNRPSLTGVMNHNQECDCEVVARAIGSHVHTNLGLPNRNKVNNPTQKENPSKS